MKPRWIGVCIVRKYTDCVHISAFVKIASCDNLHRFGVRKKLPPGSELTTICENEQRTVKIHSEEKVAYAWAGDYVKYVVAKYDNHLPVIFRVYTENTRVVNLNQLFKTTTSPRS